MAESRRKGSHLSVDLEEAAQKKRDRNTLLLFGAMMVAIVIGMVLLSKFLSGS